MRRSFLRFCVPKPLTEKTKVVTWSVVPTSTESVFTINEMDSEINFSQWNQSATKLFQSESKYIPPKDFGYQLPHEGIPEYAFVGRSNVGKSSLIDYLLGNKKIVKISKEPGCTKSINYYLLHSKTGTKAAYIVDLPGYGYAKISKEERDKWDKMIKDFLVTRDATVLRRVYVLIDSRRGPNEDDCYMIELLTRSAITHQVILTKSDLLPSMQLPKILQATFDEIMKRKRHGCLPIVHVISTRTEHGLLPLMQGIAEVNSAQYGTGKPTQDMFSAEELEANAQFLKEGLERKQQQEMMAKGGRSQPQNRQSNSSNGKRNTSRPNPRSSAKHVVSRSAKIGTKRKE